MFSFIYTGSNLQYHDCKVVWVLGCFSYAALSLNYRIHRNNSQSNTAITTWRGRSLAVLGEALDRVPHDVGGRLPVGLPSPDSKYFGLTLYTRPVVEMPSPRQTVRKSSPKWKNPHSIAKALN